MLEEAIKLKEGKDIDTIKNWIINKYGIQAVSKKKNKNKYVSIESDTYCKICGALIAEYDEEDIAFKERDNYIITFEDDELFSMIKRELQYVLSYYLYQPENAPLSIYKIIDLLTGIIRIKILEIQSELIKIKTLDDNNMWLLINIYIYIYIFAILTQFAFANPEILKFKYTSPKLNKFEKKSSNYIKDDNKQKRESKKEETEFINEEGKKEETEFINEEDKKEETEFINEEDKKEETNKKGGEKKVNVSSASKDILSQLLKHKQGKENLEKLTNHALELIKKIKYSDILSSKYITANNIKDLYLTAYKWTLTLNYNIESIEDFT
jgi:hypothetical protein